MLSCTRKQLKSNAKVTFSDFNYCCIVSIEIFGGLIAHSIAIMSDAAHLVSDALGIVISIIALKIAEREVDNKSTFGYHRAEVLGALAAYFSYGVLLSGWFMKRLLDFLTHK